MHRRCARHLSPRVSLERDGTRCDINLAIIAYRDDVIAVVSIVSRAKSNSLKNADRCELQASLASANERHYHLVSQFMQLLHAFLSTEDPQVAMQRGLCVTLRFISRKDF